MTDELKQTIAHNLKRKRWEKEWSQAFVARQLGISTRTVSRAETGQGISCKLLKRICSLYQIPLSSMYQEPTEKPTVLVNVDMIPDDMAVRLMRQSTFVGDIQREVILQFNDTIKRNALMLREEVEDILPEVIGKKQTYSLSDLVYCCMAVNQRTIQNISKIVVGQ